MRRGKFKIDAIVNGVADGVVGYFDQSSPQPPMAPTCDRAASMLNCSFKVRFLFHS